MSVLLKVGFYDTPTPNTHGHINRSHINPRHLPLGLVDDRDTLSTAVGVMSPVTARFERNQV